MCGTVRTCDVARIHSIPSPFLVCRLWKWDSTEYFFVPLAKKENRRERLGGGGEGAICRLLSRRVPFGMTSLFLPSAFFLVTEMRQIEGNRRLRKVGKDCKLQQAEISQISRITDEERERERKKRQSTQLPLRRVRTFLLPPSSIVRPKVKS